MLRKLLVLAVVVTVLMAAIPASLPVRAASGGGSYVFTTLDFPKASKTWAMANNADGDIVGYYLDTQYHGFLLRRGTLTTLDYPGADTAWTQANAINAAGDIAGSYSLKSGPAGNVHGFLLAKSGQWSTVDYPEGTHIMQGGAYGILADGTVVGCYHDGTATAATAMHGYMTGPKGTAGFDYPAGAPFAMHYSATPDGKTIVGAYLSGANTPDNWHGYMLSAGQVISVDVPGKQGTQALGIGPAGEVVGVYKVQVGTAWNAHGFVADTRGSASPTNWSFTAVDVPGATQTIVRSINVGGDLAGYYVDASGAVHGFLTRPGTQPAVPLSGSPAPLPPSTGTGIGGLAPSHGFAWSLARPFVLALAGAAALGGLALGRSKKTR
jgi:hypothetical protein